jgi:hypothetical protein
MSLSETVDRAVEEEDDEEEDEDEEEEAEEEARFGGLNQCERSFPKF